MDILRKRMVWAVVASESIHVFCCVLPTVFSVLNLLAGFGMIAATPGFIEETHNLLHHWEIPMMVTSAALLILGWLLYLYSRHINCRTDGTCRHKPCASKKDRSFLFMIIATVLFAVNITLYFGIHA